MQYYALNSLKSVYRMMAIKCFIDICSFLNIPCLAPYSLDGTKMECFFSVTQNDRITFSRMFIKIRCVTVHAVLQCSSSRIDINRGVI